MENQQTYLGCAHFPAEAPPPCRTVGALDRLENWRAGGTATAVVMAALLPCAISLHMRYPVAIAAALLTAGVLALGCHLSRESRLRTLLIYAEFEHLPALARKRRRLISPSRRRTLARELRQTACPQPPCSLERWSTSLPCTVTPLADRVVAVRHHLLAAARALEADKDPDPVAVALIRELLRDGASPLYNPNVPVADLHATLNRATFAITLDSMRTHDPVLASVPNQRVHDEAEENEP